MNKYLILIIFICLPHTNTICSEDAYPLIINGFSESVKGESIIIEDTSSNELIVYNLSYNFAKGYEKISVTKSSNPGSSNGSRKVEGETPILPIHRTDG